MSNPFPKGYRSVFQLCKTLTVKAATDYLAEDAAPPEALWAPFWHRGEICVFFSESNVGKSLVAMQIARDIAWQGRKVLYIDYELRTPQFQSRYGGCTLPAGLDRATPAGALGAELDIDSAFNDIVAAMMSGYDAIIVDNMTFLSEKISDPGKALGLMKRLKDSVSLHGCSLMLVCHTPKRDPRRPLTKADIAGSSNIINFADSAFAIGMSYLDPKLRYLKQIKVREGEFVHHGENVLVGHFDRSGNDNLIQFTPLLTQDERHHLLK